MLWAKRFDGVALSLIAATLGASGCGGSSDNQSGTGATVGAPMTGTSSVTSGTGGAPGAPSVINNTQPMNTGVTPVVTGTGGAPMVQPPMMAAGSGGMSGGQAGMGAVSNSDAWTPQSNLDAMGNLIAPAPEKGYQIASETFDLMPGQEIFNCFHVETPNDTDFAVGEWEAQMSAGSHHFILYRNDGDTEPSGTLSDSGCTLGFGGSTWLYTQGSPRNHLAFPEGVAMVLPAHERIVFDMHYINTTDQTIHAHIALNMYKVKSETYMKAGSQVSFNVGIAIPPNGMQTVEGDCQPVPGANYFIMQTHTHKRGILATITRNLANGQMGEEFVHTTDWEHPDAHEWMTAPFLTFAAGESFHYSCTYMNDRDSYVTVGTSAELNEMCMAEAYYFPANGETPTCN
jgi:hypothetical protein